MNNEKKKFVGPILTDLLIHGGDSRHAAKLVLDEYFMHPFAKQTMLLYYKRNWYQWDRQMGWGKEFKGEMKAVIKFCLGTCRVPTKDGGTATFIPTPREVNQIMFQMQHLAYVSDMLTPPLVMKDGEWVELKHSVEVFDIRRG